MSTAIKYRPDIDGLRSVSVLAVILFHAGFGFPGGFVGVDVFFVISGFLITSLIVKDLEAGTFSLARFWSRRIKRIWPAAMMVTLASLVTGYFLFLPEAYTTLSRDAIAQTCMVANFEFARTVNYFNAHADLRPLLHTWSLAVEEQFYVFFPVFLMLVWRLGRRAVVPILVLGALLSLGLSVWGTDTHPTATFYLLPTRMWELMFGSLLAICKPRPLQSRLKADAVSLAGLGLIGWSCFFYTNWMPFPGLAAVPPCLGAVMVIYAGQSRTGLTYRALSVAPMRIIGLMSYSLYLWHWPILAFMRYTIGYEIPTSYLLLALVATGVLSFLSWRFIETPTRKIKDSVGLPRIAGVAAVMSLTLIGSSFLILRSEGVPTRFDEAVLVFGKTTPTNGQWNHNGPLAGTVWDEVVPIGAYHEGDGPVDFLLWGDSHAQGISQAVHGVASRLGIAGAAAIEPMNSPIPGTWRPLLGSPGMKMARRNERVLEWIRENTPKTVILCSRWSIRVDGRPDTGALDSLLAPVGDDTVSLETARGAFRDGLQRLVDECDRLGIEVVILTEPPYQPVLPQTVAIRAALTKKPIHPFGIAREAHKAHQRTVESLLGQLHGDDLRIVPLAGPLFDEQGRSVVEFDGKPLYFDNDHLSSEGAEVYLDEILEETLRAGAQASEEPSTP